jgi:hypothetical protein
MTGEEKKGEGGRQCCESGMFIPDPGFDFFPSWIPDTGSASKNLSIFTPKNGF